MLNYYLSGNDAFRLKLYIPENNQTNDKQKKEPEMQKSEKK